MEALQDRSEKIRVQDASVEERAGWQKRTRGDLARSLEVDRAIADRLIEEWQSGQLVEVEEPQT